jgi:hypothetical protein
MLCCLFAVPLDGSLLLIGRFGPGQALRDYTDLATLIPLIIVVIILYLVIPRAKDRSLQKTTTILAIGFVLQVAFSLVWIYYWHFTKRGGMPDVSIGDAFYLGSYVFWTAATLPYIKRYGTLISRRSLSILAIYGLSAATIVYVSTKYWYNATVLYGYSSLATAVWLSYPVAATICLFFMIAVALLYGYEGYGKGLLTNYWLYFLLPIMLIGGADLLNGFYYVLSENTVPGRLDDVLYIAGYAVAMAAGLTVLGSRLDRASVLPSPEEHILKNGPVRISKGTGVIVEDAKSALSFELFASLITPDESGLKREGYILSRRTPEAIREEFGFKDVPITWIATQAGQEKIDPTKPNLMAHAVMEFFSKTKDGVVLIDGIESVMVHNDFSRTVRMLEQINDFVMEYQGYLIVPIEPRAFSSRERAILERNFETFVVPRVDARESGEKSLKIRDRFDDGYL